VADAPLSRRTERTRLSTRRLLGLDRSGPPPPQTLAGQPWNPWTLPNAIGFVRLALLPVFLALASLVLWLVGDGAFALHRGRWLAPAFGAVR